MLTVRADPSARTLAIDPATMTVRSVVSTIDPDRAGDVIVPTGLRNVEEFLMNPVVLWAHNRVAVPPVGVCEWLDVQPSRIVAQTKFAQGVPFAEDVFRLYEQGVLRGWSIGFVPRRAHPRPGRKGLRVEEWDLLEYSAVPIPENPGALTVALQKGLVRDGTLRDWLAQVPDDRGGKWVTTGDVLTELVRAEVVHSE
ncbi:MAG TPA: HK97 family phage prohead protease [Fimbriiglobus sp.]|nr:HK97 family phage prohead protease [Fimbriiglobus sp.]